MKNLWQLGIYAEFQDSEFAHKVPHEILRLEMKNWGFTSLANEAYIDIRRIANEAYIDIRRSEARRSNPRFVAQD